MTPQNQSLPYRSQVPPEQTWDLASLFASPTEWEDACNELESRLPHLSAYQGRLSEGPAILLKFLNEYQEAAAMVDRIFSYASNGSAVDTTDQAASARHGQARSLAARHAAAVSFFNPELISIGFDRLYGWIETTPELSFFTHYLERLQYRQEHVRSDEVEQVLALASDAFTGPYSTYSMLNSADLAFQPATVSDGTRIEVGQSSIGSLLTHPDREVRRTAWENYADAYLAFRNTFAGTLTAVIKQDVFTARARGYPSGLHAALGANYIPVEVFHNLIVVFQKNLPTWYRYWRLRKRMLGYERLHVYDIRAPLNGQKPAVPYEQAVDWICAGMAPLGEEYVSILRRGCLEERWVDRARNKGKREGAYSSGGVKGVHPLILMSYAGDLFSLSTLAHELGHSMHSHYTWSTQPYIYGRYGLFLAEVASNFNQAMVRDYLFRTQTGRDFQIALIEEALSNYHRYFFIMPTLARFELEAHRRAEVGAPLSAAVLIDLLADLFAEGYGDVVEFDRERIGITWAQFGHLYMNFYVYMYATGISGANALSRRILDGEPGAVERYLDFLKSGGSDFPLNTLKRAGVDLSSPEPVGRAFEVLSGLVDRLESLVEGPA